jgi:outer membrane protein assembly factor BamB
LLWSVLFVLNSSLIKAQNIGQWRGPNRDGIFEGKNLLKEWPEKGPELIWAIEGIGKGFSSQVISNGIIYTTGNKGSQDILTSIDQEGNVRWQVDYGSSWNRSYPDTRSTPTVEDQRIYVISGQGEIVSMDTRTGRKLWSVDAYRKYEGQHGEWGIAESLLLVDDKVIYTPGGNKTTIVAINKMTGKTVWQSESLKDTTAYVSPLLIRYGEKKSSSILLQIFYLVLTLWMGRCCGNTSTLILILPLFTLWHRLLMLIHHFTMTDKFI